MDKAEEERENERTARRRRESWGVVIESILANRKSCVGSWARQGLVINGWKRRSGTKQRGKGLALRESSLFKSRGISNPNHVQQRSYSQPVLD